MSRYPNRGIGDTVKATYLLQSIPMWRSSLGERLSALATHRRQIFRLIGSRWIAKALHNMPTFFTRYR